MKIYISFTGKIICKHIMYLSLDIEEINFCCHEKIYMIKSEYGKATEKIE